MKTTQRILWKLIVVGIVLVGCQSTPPSTEGQSGLYFESHLDAKKFGREQLCCTASGKKVAVSAGGPGSAQAGFSMYEKGGNIVDATVATAFALAVERPAMCGLGGGGFLTLYLNTPKGKETHFIDFREMAPAKSTRNMFLDASGNPIPKASTMSGLAVATPGFVSGLYDVHKKWGKLPWKTVLEPAIILARDGFVFKQDFYERIEKAKKDLAADKELSSLYLDDKGEPLAVGTKIVQKNLAKTLTIIAKSGKKGFHEGPIAKKIVETVKAHQGILQASDLKNYKANFTKPLSSAFKSYVLIAPPPPSSGGVLMTEMLNVLDSYDLPKQAQSPAQYVHLLAEVMRRAYADRSVFIGDPAFFKEDYTKIMTKEYAESLRKGLSADKVTPSSEVRPGAPLLPNTKSTTNLSIIDSEGNAAASTISLNTSFGTAIGVPGTGIILNNTMDDFSIKPGEKNSYGLLGNEGNSIQPFKRPVSSMSPSIVLASDTKSPVLVVGGGGGSKIISGAFQVILNDLILYPYDLKKAVFAPRVHHQWQPDKLDLEPGFSEGVQNDLKKKGHEIIPPPWLQQIYAVGYNPGTQEFTAASDPRFDGGALAK